MAYAHGSCLDVFFDSRRPTRTSSGLRRSATMPELEPTSHESIMSYSDEAMLLEFQGDSLPTLVAEPDVDEFSTAAGLATISVSQPELDAWPG